MCETWVMRMSFPYVLKLPLFAQVYVRHLLACRMTISQMGCANSSIEIFCKNMLKDIFYYVEIYIFLRLNTLESACFTIT